MQVIRSPTGRRLLVTKVQIENLMWCVVAPWPDTSKNQPRLTKVPPSGEYSKWQWVRVASVYSYCLFMIFSVYTTGGDAN